MISICDSDYDNGLMLYKFSCPVEPSYPDDFLCGTDEFDEKSLKRLIPIKKHEDFSWKIFIQGHLYHVVEYGDAYELLHEDGSIVKNEQIEAILFNHMFAIEKQEPVSV